MQMVEMKAQELLANIDMRMQQVVRVWMKLSGLALFSQHCLGRPTFCKLSL